MVFTVPLFFLPLSPFQLGMDSYSKYFLLGIMTLLLGLLFLIKQVQTKSLKIYRSPLDIAILLSLLAFFIASIVGVDQMNSFFGNLSNTNLPFFSFLFFGLLYLLLFNLIDSKSRAIAIFRTLVLSFLFLVLGVFVVVFFYNSHGALAYIRLIVGTTEDFAVYLVYFIIFSLSFLSSTNLKKKVFPNKKINIIYNFILLLAVILVVRFDFLYAWWVLLIGALLVIALRFIFSFNNKGQNKKRLVVPILLVFTAINFLLNFYLVVGADAFDARLSQYRQINNIDSLILAKDTLVDNIFFGVGLDNFDYTYSRYRPVVRNENSNWDIRYNKSGSFVADLLLGGGLFGLAFIGWLIFLIVLYCFKALFLFQKDSKRENTCLNTNKEVSVVLIPVILAMLIAFIFYSATASSLFLFVLLIAIFMRMNADEDLEVYDIGNNKNLVVNLIFGFFFIFCIVFLTVNVKFLIADTRANYKNIEESKLLKSATLSPNRYQYNLNLAKLFAGKAKISTKKSELKEAIRYQRQSMNHLRLAMKTGTNSVVTQETAGMIYRDFSLSDDNNNQLAIDAFKRALALEPTNPAIATNIGEALLKAENYEQASSYFQKALDLKNDYKPAKLGLAKSLIARGEAPEALTILEKLAKDTMDPSVYYELGLLHFNEGRFKKAKTAFSSALTLSPLYANALFGLALSLEKTGETEQALYYLKKLQRLNPANEEVGDKIKKLEQE